MELKDIIPSIGDIRNNYCDLCQENLRLEFILFKENLSGIDLEIDGLPILACGNCKERFFPDRTILALMDCHKRSIDAGNSFFRTKRKKTDKDFGFTIVKFQYDSDDYFYIPGLYRDFDEGFLTPVFFNKRVLIKFDTSPEYHVEFSSTTYGTIFTDDYVISFGINNNGLLVMWLGDIAKLPDTEQYYLRSENVPSDHCLGSEFYDAQIECEFTEPTKESELFRARSEFIACIDKNFDINISQLDEEVLQFVSELKHPIVDTEKERRFIADSLNKIYLESFSKPRLTEITKKIGASTRGTGSIKLLEAIVSSKILDDDLNKIMKPFYVLYDLRVVYSHLTSETKKKKTLHSVEARLGLQSNAGIGDIYVGIINKMTQSFIQMKNLLSHTSP